MQLQRTESEQFALSKVGKIRRTRKKEFPRRKKVGEQEDDEGQREDK